MSSSVKDLFLGVDPAEEYARKLREFDSDAAYAKLDLAFARQAARREGYIAGQSDEREAIATYLNARGYGVLVDDILRARKGEVTP